MSDTYERFCRRPKDPETAKSARAEWRKFRARTHMSSARRLIQHPQDATKQDWFRCVGTFSGNMALLACMHMIQRLDLRYNAAALLAKTAEIAVPTDLEILKAFPMSILTEVYDGEVVSVCDKEIIVHFRINDDLEERRVRRSMLARDVCEGQPIQARCHLELVPPARALTDEEVAAYEKEYEDMTKLLDEFGLGRESGG